MSCGPGAAFGKIIIKMITDISKMTVNLDVAVDVLIEKVKQEAVKAAIAAAEEAAQPLKYEGSADRYNTVYLDLLDQNNYYDAQGESQWNLPFQIPSYLGGEY